MEISNDIIDRLDLLLKTKSFRSLNEAERELVLLYIGSEKEYAALRQVEQTLNTSASLTAPDDVLRGLRQKMSDRRRLSFRWSGLLVSRVPAYYIVATAIIIIFLKLPDRTVPDPVPNQRIVTVRDTVFLPSISDTIFVDRVVYKRIRENSPVPAVTVVNAVPKESPPSQQGISMEEQEELEKFLVSGS